MKKILFFLALMAVSTFQATDIFYEISHGNYKNVKTFCRSSSDHLIKNDQGQSILHVAAISGDSKMVKAVLPFCDDVNLRDHAGKTALDYAVAHGYQKVILTLAAKNAKVTDIADARFVAMLMAQERKYFWIRLVVKIGLLIPFSLVAGSLIGISIAQSVFGIAISIAGTSGWGYLIVGATTAFTQCFLMPWYCAIPLGLAWSAAMIESGGMLVLGAIYGPVIAFWIGIVGIIDCTTRRRDDEMYLLVA